MAFIFFSEVEKEIANNTDLVGFLRSHGESVKRAGCEYVWQSPGGKVSINGSEWYSQYEQTGGGAVLFVRKFFGQSFPEAVRSLLGHNAGTEIITRNIPDKSEEKMPFELPPKHSDMCRVYGYLLNERLLDRDVIYEFAHEGLLYEDAEHHNAVFVGNDLSGNPVHAHKRSTVPGSDFKNNVAGSNADYSFHWVGTTDRLYVFEAPIDMLAYISLNKSDWQQHSYVSLCSTADRAAIQLLKDYPNLRSVYLCLDHDSAGIEGAYRIADSIRNLDSSYSIWRVLPRCKDWDEDIKALHGKEAISASEHERLSDFLNLYSEVLQEIKEKIQEVGTGERLQKYKGDNLFSLVRLYLSLADNTNNSRMQIAALKDSCKSLLIGCYARCLQIQNPVDIEKIAERMKACYKPYRDYNSTEQLGQEINKRLNAVEDVLNRQIGISLTETQKVLAEMVALSADCLRQCGNISREQQSEEMPLII